eukprot:m.283468 g.283468  ORF g.283468 m.283468 type:complete len:971 (+) comp40670_c0_seq41:2177-5089(+)
MPNSATSFSWSRADLDQLLCLRIEDIPHCQWSSGFLINAENSFHVTMKGALDRSYFVRVEVTLKEATYHVVISDTGRTPPPFKIENLSKIPVVFYQKHIADSSLRREIKPSQSLPYAWDDTTLPAMLCLNVSDGDSQTYDISTDGEKEPLTYQNYVYVAATNTLPSSQVDRNFSSQFKSGTSSSSSLGAMHRHFGHSSFGGGELVLDVPQGRAVLFKRREANRSSQLWRVTALGNLEHMGSASGSGSGSGSGSISQSRVSLGTKPTMVLDIADERPGKKAFLLMIRPLDKRRISTQTWKFDEEGRLFCQQLSGMYVQPKDGYFADGCDVVLAPCWGVETRIPSEQRLSVLKQKEGTGALAVSVVADGPIRLVKIRDKIPQRRSLPSIKRFASSPRSMESCADVEPAAYADSSFQVIINLSSGVGLSVVNSLPEELVYVALTGFEINYLSLKGEQLVEVIVQHIQADNQLIGIRQQSALLYRTPETKQTKRNEISTFSVHVNRAKALHPGVEIFKRVEVCLRPISLQIDERLLLKFIQFLGLGKSDEDDSKEDLYTSTTESANCFPASATHYYCRNLLFKKTELRVGLRTAANLTEDLQAIRNQIRIPFVKFEDALVALKSYKRNHSFGTLSGYADRMGKFYTKQLLSKLATILGSTDFLGNPVGLLNDVASGVEKLVKGNIVGLVKDVTHGVSDSASKLTSTVSGVLNAASMDDDYSEERAQIKATARTSGEHLVAGIQGLGHSLVGGLTSVFTQTAEGAAKEGVTGFFTGFVKGVVGTVAKPVGGVLDLAASTAAAVSAGTKSKKLGKPSPVRRPRHCIGVGGVLPLYSSNMARGWEILLVLNDGDPREQLVCYEGLSFKKEEEMCILVSSEQLFVFGKIIPSRADQCIVHAKLSNLSRCIVDKKKGDGTSFLQMTVMEENRGCRVKQIRCDKEKIAKRVSQYINYAKTLYEHVQLTVQIPPEKIKAIW